MSNKGIDEKLEKYVQSIGGSKGIIFVGANTGDEIPFLKTISSKIYAFEPINHPSIKEQLFKYADSTVEIFNYAITDFNGNTIMYPAVNNFHSSSTLKPTKHLEEFPVPFTEPITVECRRLDYFDFFKSCDCLFIDVQGAELNVLNGVSDFSNIKLVYCEYTSFQHLYENQCLFKDLNYKLESLGFHFCETLWAYHNPVSKIVHGDAIWRKL
jgi:FkbM family methyltransferase